MEFGIITHYDVHNHGALLQMNALVKVLKKEFNINAQALQFEKNYDFLGHEMKAKYEISLKSIKIYINYLKERGLKIFFFNIKKKRLFEQFKKKENLIGKYYTEYDGLDAIIIGSDEVFALHTGPTPVFFGHALPSDIVFSYAASFGPTTISDIKRLHCEAFVKSGLASMKGLSMRDYNSMKITKELTGRDSTLVVDPVILYGYQDELSKCTRPILSPYLLVYAYETRMNTHDEITSILNFAHSKGLKVVCPGFYHKWADINVNVDPIELLSYFKYADCVVTDTFHGGVLSIITGREIGVKIRDNKNKLFHLLTEYGLENRIIGDDWDLDSIFSMKQNNIFITQEINRRKALSLNYIKSMFESNEC